MRFILLILPMLSLSACQEASVDISTVEGAQSKSIRAMIEAVNEKDADKYVAEFAEDVQVYLDTLLRIDGRTALRNNRSNHFKQHPEVRSEIQHLVEIDNKVILHDKVWFDKEDTQGKSIVEVFTFKDGKVTRVDVIQPRDLFE